MPVELHEEEIPFFAEVIAGGRITIPEEIRKIFEVKDGELDLIVQLEARYSRGSLGMVR